MRRKCGQTLKSRNKRQKWGQRLALTCLLLALFFPIYHEFKSAQEAELRKVSPQLVTVNDKKLSLSIQGRGDQTLVLLAGAGTTSPILDFKTLSTALAPHYQVVVLERLGYGFSQDGDESRNLAALVAEQRAMLKEAGIAGPYVLMPHSMSGLTALAWAKAYPQEVTAIIGLDMSPPAAYAQLSPWALPLARLGSGLGKFGAGRWLPDAIYLPQSDLSPKEQTQYRALFKHRPLSQAMINELQQVKVNADSLTKAPLPQLPYLLFSSNGQGTGFSKEAWQTLQADLAQKTQAQQACLDAPHYLHHQPMLLLPVIQDFLNASV